MRNAAFAAVLLWTGTLLAADPAAPVRPDAAHLVNGRAAMWVTPGRSVEDDAAPLPEGCTVHVKRPDPGSPERRFPCREWFLPEPGTNMLWLEATGQISGGWTYFTVPMPPAKGGSRSRVPLVEAATVRIPEAHWPAGGTMHLFAFSGKASVFDRLIESAKEGRAGVRVPAGTVLMVAFNRYGEAIAAAKPVKLEPGTTHVYAPAPLRGNGGVLALLKQPKGSPRPREVRLFLRGPSGAILPDELKVTSSGVYAFWHSIAPGSYGLAADDFVFSSGTAAPILIEVGKITTFEDRLAHPASSHSEKE